VIGFQVVMNASRIDKFHTTFLVIGILIGSVLAYFGSSSNYGAKIEELNNEIDSSYDKIDELESQIIFLNNSLDVITQQYETLLQNYSMLKKQYIDKKTIIVVLETSIGNIELEIYSDKAPITVNNFMRYVNQSFYDGLVFHRVIDDFVIQGGGYRPNGTYRESLNAPIELESNNGLSNVRGSISMARGISPNSARAQFFINLVNNSFLDYKDESNPGYCVFGKVVKGMDVVDRIGSVETSSKNIPNYGYVDDWPVSTILINSVYRKDN